MKQMNSTQFRKQVEHDPSWASKLTEEVEITDYCEMKQSNIAHLSSMLTFSGRNLAGDVASFAACKHLKRAEGNFAGGVNFNSSGIEQIGQLVVTRPNERGTSATFFYCSYLQSAEGTFHGLVDFSSSGIRRIGNLAIRQTSAGGCAAEFRLCENLKTATGTFPGHVDFSGSNIEEIRDLIVTHPNEYGEAASFGGCLGLRTAAGIFAGSVDFQQSGIVEIGDLQITEPCKLGQFLCFYYCPIVDDPKEIEKAFLGKPIEVLKSAHEKCVDPSVKLALNRILVRTIMKRADPGMEL